MSTTNLPGKLKTGSPAVRALFIQLGSLCFIAVFLSIVWHVFQVRLSLNQALLFQSLLTLMLTRWLNLAWWWCVIQPLFPFAVALTLVLSLPSYVYLLLFLFFLVSYWSTYRTQVPYYPSTKPVWLAIERLLPSDRPVACIDIGSGLGGLVLHLANRRVDSKFTGVEIAPLPWLVSYLRAGTLRNAHFLRNKYEIMDFSEFDVVFAYLSPAAMSAVWIKAKREMRPGSMLISYEFPINGVEADLSINPRDSADQPGTSDRRLYIWTL